MRFGCGRRKRSPASTKWPVITANPQAQAEHGVAWVGALVRWLEIPPLRTYGVTQADVPMLVEKAAQASSMKGNPVALTEEELCEIISRSL